MKSTHASWSLPECRDDRRALVGREPERAEDVGHLGRLGAGLGARLGQLARALDGVVLGVAPGRQVPAQAHRDPSGRDLGEARDHDEPGAADGTREPRGQRERHREPVRHPDHHVPDAVARGEVSFDVRRLRHNVLSAS